MRAFLSGLALIVTLGVGASTEALPPKSNVVSGIKDYGKFVKISSEVRLHPQAAGGCVYGWGIIHENHQYTVTRENIEALGGSVEQGVDSLHFWEYLTEKANAQDFAGSFSGKPGIRLRLLEENPSLFGFGKRVDIGDVVRLSRNTAYGTGLICTE